jgi:hypothetical protein
MIFTLTFQTVSGWVVIFSALRKAGFRLISIRRKKCIIHLTSAIKRLQIHSAHLEAGSPEPYRLHVGAVDPGSFGVHADDVGGSVGCPAWCVCVDELVADVLVALKDDVCGGCFNAKDNQDPSNPRGRKATHV